MAEQIETVENPPKKPKRDIPERPSIWGDGYDDKGEIIYDMYDCPNCGKSYEMDYEKYNFCPNCGQALDWSEENGI